MQRLIATLNRMQERLAALVRGRTILAGAISHDLRTYLTRLRLRVDAIEDLAERAGAESDIDAMTGIVENALAFAQSASRAGPRETLDLAALLRSESEHYAAQGAAVRWLLPADPVPVAGDGVALKRVLANLVDNALRYAGEAVVTLSAADDFAGLTVDDHGKGIPAEEREVVFEPFYRLDASRSRESGGTGLGLALTRQIVEAHDGRITALEAPGGGTRMQVMLPLAT
jgi:signal transduction histidine kinase